MRRGSTLRLVTLLAAVAFTLAGTASAWSPNTVSSSTLTQVKWASSAVSWKINAAHGSNITGSDSDVTNAMRNAFLAWSSIGNKSLTITESGTSSDTVRNNSDQVNTMLFADSTTSGSMGSGTLAVTFSVFNAQTGALVDADIVFNTSKNFFTTTVDSGRFDLQSVATHEVGHLLGLDHSSVLGATMFQSTATGSVSARTLSEDDIAGLRSTYPGSTALGSITGRIRRNSAGVLGAAVLAVGSDGNVASATISQDSNGAFTIKGLATGTYSLGVDPLDGPMQQANLGGFFSVVGTFDTTFNSRAPSGSFSVTAGSATNAGDIDLGSGSNAINPQLCMTITDTSASSFSFGSSTSVDSGATGKSLFVKHVNGITSATAITITGSGITLGTPTTGSLFPSGTFSKFPLTIGTGLATSERTIVFSESGNTGMAQGGILVIGASVPAPNNDPNAIAGPDLAVRTATNTSLSGSATDADGDPITYSWAITTQPSGGDAVLTNASSRVATFRATRAGTYVATLTVSDGRGGSDTDTANITVNDPPVVNAGQDRGITLLPNTSLVVNLTGAASDPDGSGIASYTWTRNGGTGATVVLTGANSANASFTVTSSGTYVFKLTVRDSLNAEGNDEVTISVTQAGAPTANAGEDQNLLKQEGVPLTVRLSGQGIDPEGEPIRSYAWSRVDAGPTVTLDDPNSPTPSFVVTTAGTYQFSLKVTDVTTLESTNSAIVTITVVENRAPVASAGQDQALVLQEGETLIVRLSGSATDADNDSIQSYAWTRSGGTGPAVTLSDATVASPTFAPPAAGTYVFSLQASDSRGGTSSNSTSVTITVTFNARPIADAGPDRTLFIQQGGSVFVQLSGSATDPDSDAIVGYRWTRAGGGGPAVTLSDATAAAPNFTAQASGTYSFQLEATDARGGVSSNGDTVTITIGAQGAPVANAGPDRRVSIRQGETVSVQLSGTATDPDGDAVVVYEWTRAGGTGPAVALDNAASPRPTFTAALPGTYLFRLSVTDAVGTRSTNDPTVTVTVGFDLPPVASAGSDFSAVVVPGGTALLALSGSGSDPDGDPLTYAWTRAGGTGPAVTLSNPSSARPSFVVTAAGTYIFRLEVTDAGGQKSANLAQVTATVSADRSPVASAGASQSVLLGEGGAVRVVLTGSATDPDGDAILSYGWSRVPGLGGGTGPAVTLGNPAASTTEFFAIAAGTYVFSLLASDAHGAVSTNTALTTVTVTASPRPVANAGTDQTVIVQEGGSIQVVLSGSGTDPENRRITRYSWSRAGGTGPAVSLSDASSASPRFTAPAPGTYVFALTVVNEIGGTSNNSALVTITVALNRVPVASAGPNPTVFLPEGGFVDVTLAGSGSDPDGDAITGFAWTRSGGNGPDVSLNDPSAQAPTFRAVQAGTYTFALRVTDARGGRSAEAALVNVTVEANGRPAANAGADRSVLLQEGTTAVVRLEGSGSDPEGGVLQAYTWTRTGGTGPAVALSSPASRTPTFAVTVAGTYVFELTVTDSRGADSSNTARVTITAVLNRRPEARAGLGQRLELVAGTSARVVLSGTGVDPDGDAITGYVWTRTGGTGPAIQLDGAASSSASFTAAASGTYVFSLEVTDARGARSVQGALVTIEVVTNRRPVPQAGPDTAATVQAGRASVIGLTGAALDPDGDAVPVYSWRRAGGTGPPVVLLDSNTAAPSFVADQSGTYVFELEVTDARGGRSLASSKVTVTIRINRKPVVSAGGDFSVTAGSTVALDASAFDPDGDTVHYSWTQVSGPASPLEGATSSKLAFSPPEAGTYEFEIAADDAKGGTDSDRIALTAMARPRSRLGAVAVSALAERVDAGQLLAVDGVVASVGDAATAQTVVRFVLTRDQTIDRDDFVLGRSTVGALAPGASTQVRASFPLPSSLPPGRYFVGLATDEAGLDAGVNAKESVVASQGSVEVLAVNLVALALSGPEIARAGSTIGASLTLANTGTAAAQTAFRADLFLSRDETLDPSDIALGAALVNALAVGAQVVVPVTARIPEETPPASYRLFALADASNAVGEPVRSDNSVMAAGMLTVMPLPAFNVVLEPGLNLISFPYDPSLSSAPFRMESLVGEGELLVRLPDLIGAGFEAVMGGAGAAPFSAEAGAGYIVTRRGARRTVAITGRDWPASAKQVALRPGLNLFSIPAGTLGTFDLNALVDASGATFVARHAGDGRFEAHVPGLTPGFSLQSGKAYLMSVPASRTISLP